MISKKNCLLLFYGAEYFSYYAIMTTLVLFFTRGLHMGDNESSNLVGNYSSLLYLMPIFGGIFADRFKASLRSLFFGGLILAVGFILYSAVEGEISLYFAMTVVILGFGLFRTNIYGVVRKYAEVKSLDGVYVQLYYIGNLGSFVGIIVAGYFNQYGFHTIFISAAIIFLLAWLIFALTFRESLKKEFTKEKNTIFFLLVCAITFGIFYYILYRDYVSILMLVLFICGLLLFARLYAKRDKKDTLRLNIYLVLVVFALTFWIVDFQIYNGLELFIDKMVNRNIGSFVVPTQWVNAVNAIAIVIVGFFLSRYFSKGDQAALPVRSLYKFLLGLVIITLAYVLLTFFVYRGVVDSEHVSVFHMIYVMAMIGVAELFIDPIAIANAQNISKNQNTLTGLYMVFSGSIASYLAGQVSIMLNPASSTKAPLHNYLVGLTKIDIALGVSILLLFVIACVFAFKLYSKKNSDTYQFA